MTLEAALILFLGIIFLVWGLKTRVKPDKDMLAALKNLVVLKEEMNSMKEQILGIEQQILRLRQQIALGVQTPVKDENQNPPKMTGLESKNIQQDIRKS
jgi:hypothetical protein